MSCSNRDLHSPQDGGPCDVDAFGRLHRASDVIQEETFWNHCGASCRVTHVGVPTSFSHGLLCFCVLCVTADRRSFCISLLGLPMERKQDVSRMLENKEDHSSSQSTATEGLACP